MTDQPAAILATFAHFLKPIASRKVVPIVFEVPIEEFSKVIAALGTPDAANPVWCGIARVSPETGKAGVAAVTRTEGDRPEASPRNREPERSPPATKPKRHWRDMPASQRAAMLVNDPEFIEFLEASGNPWDAGINVTADQRLKSLLDIRSKSELDSASPRLLAAYEKIEGNFRAWQQARGHSREAT